MVLALGAAAYLLPVCAGMQHTGEALAEHTPLPEASDRELFEDERIDAGVCSPPADLAGLHSDASRLQHDPKFCTRVYLYQASFFDASVWIDEGDTAEFVCSTVQDAVFVGDDVRVIPVCPQPSMRVAVFLDAPDWVVQAFRTPVFIEVHAANVCRFMEVFVGSVDLDCIRLAVGQKWIVGGQVYVGQDTSPLQYGQIAQIFPGVLIRVFPSRSSFRPCHMLEHKIADPHRWFNVEAPSPHTEEESPRHIGLVGTMGDWSTVPAGRVSTVPRLQREIEEASGCSERHFYVIAPERHPADLHFRGDKVVSTLAVVPRATARCCTVFLDARDLAIPLQALFLPFAITNLTHVLRLAGGDRPSGLRLCVTGASRFDADTEQLLPHHRALIHVSVDRGCAWDSQLAPSDHPPSIVAPGPGHPGNEAASSQADGQHGPPRGSRAHASALQDAPQGVGRSNGPDGFKVLPLHVHTEVSTVVHRSTAELPLGGSGPTPADIGFLHEAGEENCESEPPVPSSPARPPDWRLPVRVLSYQTQDVFRILFVADGESVAEVHTRASILLPPEGPACEVLIPDPQPCQAWLTAIVAPCWWRALGLHAVLVTERDAVERDHVALCHGGVLTASVLPDALDEDSRRIDAYSSGHLLEAGSNIDPGTLLFLQRPGAPAPQLPNAQQIVQDYTVDCDEHLLPVPEAAPPLRYLLLDDRFGQTLIELQYGPVCPQVAAVAPCEASDVKVWFQKGPSGVFGNIGVQGRVVQKCLGYRVLDTARDHPGHMVFIDARQLGIQICCRLFSQTIFRVEDFVAAIGARVAGGFEARFSGGHPVGGDPLVQQVEHCGSVTLRVHWTSPLPPPTIFSEESGDDTHSDSDEEFTGGCGDVPLAAEPARRRADTLSRSRSPARKRDSVDPAAHTELCSRPLDRSQRRRVPTPCRAPPVPPALAGEAAIHTASCIDKVPGCAGIDTAFGRLGAAAIICEEAVKPSPLPTPCRNRDNEVTWKGVHSEQACLPCPPSDTSDSCHDYPSSILVRFASQSCSIVHTKVAQCAVQGKDGGSCPTVLEASAIAGRQSHLARVYSALQQVGQCYTGALLVEEDANCPEPRGTVPCVISLDALVPPSLSDDVANTLSCLSEGSSVCTDSAFCTPTGFTSAHLWDLLQFVPWSALRQVPVDLKDPVRFQTWADAGNCNIRPAANEVLIVTADASFYEDSGRAGIGLVFASCSAGHHEPRIFRGCAYGSVHSVLVEAGCEWKCPDAHLAETVGLLWAAVSVFQLRARQHVIFECDCQSALESMQGSNRPRDHVVGFAAKAFHSSLSFYAETPCSYRWIPGHVGQAANELADALAARGALESLPAAPFRLCLQSWFAQGQCALRWMPHAFWAQRFPESAPGASPGHLCWHAHTPDLVGEPFGAIFPFLSEEVLQPDVPTRTRTLTFPLHIVTYNVLSIAEPKAGCHGRPQGLHAEVGRVKLLAACLQDHAVSLAGFQETRTPEGQGGCGDYARFCTGTDDGRNFGCEIWLNVRSWFGRGQSAFQFSASHVTVLHTEPTCLVCRIRNHAVDWQVACLHAPHRAHSDAHRAQWWARISARLRSVDTGGCWILLSDANVRLGSELSAAVSDVHADEQDAIGGMAHELFLALRTYVPSTFSQCMVGPGATLFHKRNGKADRSDYVCLPQAWQSLDTCVRVEPSISAGHKCMDHLALFVTVELNVVGSVPPKRRAWSISADAIRAPENRACIDQILQAAPRCAWDLSVHEHVAALTTYLQDQLHAHFPAETRRMRTGFFSEKTSGLHQSLCAARSMLRDRHKALRCTRVRCAFYAWKAGLGPPAFTDLFRGRWLAQLQCHIALNTWQVSQFGTLLRRSCRQDKATHVAKLADELETAPGASIHAAFKDLVRPHGRKVQGNRPLPRLKQEDGSYCRTPEEIQARWRRHFAAIEAGGEVSPAALVAACVSAQQAKGGLQQVECASLPTYHQLELTLRDVAPRKAAGPDRIPPDLGRVFSARMAELLWPVLLKTVLYSAEAVGYKGSVLHRIPKPHGDRSLCSASRAITVQSIFSKVVQKSLRYLATEEFEKRSHPMLFGGRKGQSATFGAFSSRTFLRQAKAKGISAAIAFFDLSAAFYGVVRELLTGPGQCSRSVVELAQGLGLSEGNLQALSHIAATDPVISAADTPVLHQLSAEIGQATWFYMYRDSAFTETHRGTRPGGPWADVLFHLLFTKISARAELPPAGCEVPTLPWDGRREPVPAPAATECHQRLPVRDITYADDLAVCACSSHAACLSVSVTYAAASALDAIGAHGLVPNYGPTKTAVLLAPCGPESRRVRDQIFNKQRGLLPTLLELSGGVNLQAVHKYKHLGGTLTHVGHLLTEIRCRIACAGTSFQEGRRLVYCCPKVSLQRRVRLFQSRVMSVLFHASGTWHSLSIGEFREIATAYLNFCRRMLRIPHDSDQHWTTAQIFTAVGLPDCLTCLRVERLRFLAQLASNAADTVWALARADADFLRAQQDALTWLYDWLRPTISLPSPLLHWPLWAEMLKERPRRWKGWIKRAVELQMRSCQLQALQDTLQRRLWEPAARAPVAAFPQGQHGCLQCSVAFETRQAWASHAARAHGYRAKHTLLAKGTKCQACMRQFASHAKFVRHLQALPKCLAYVEQLAGEGRLCALSEATGHVQAPPSAPDPSGRPTAVAVLVKGCPALVSALCQQAPTTEDDVLALATSFIEPFSTLRESLEVVSGLEDGSVDERTQAAVRQLLPRFHVECLCRTGQVLKHAREATGFVPRVVPFPPTRTGSQQQMVCVGDCSFCELTSRVPPSACLALRFEELEGWHLPAHAGFCAFIPKAPLRGTTFLQPSASSLRLMRTHVRWAHAAASALAAFFQAASAGRIASILFAGSGPSDLEPFREGLMASGASCCSLPSGLLLVSPRIGLH